MSLRAENEACAAHGQRSYLGQPPLTPSERRERDRLLADENLRTRLAYAELAAKQGSGRPAQEVHRRLTHIRCQVCRGKNVRLPNTRCLDCR